MTSAMTSGMSARQARRGDKAEEGRAEEGRREGGYPSPLPRPWRRSVCSPLSHLPTAQRTATSHRARDAACGPVLPPSAASASLRTHPYALCFHASIRVCYLQYAHCNRNPTQTLLAGVQRRSQYHRGVRQLPCNRLQYSRQRLPDHPPTIQLAWW
eukprot:1655234-Rhodomonas_salina.1